MAVPMGVSQENAIIAAVFALQFEQPISDDSRNRMTHSLLEADRYPGFLQMPSPMMNFVIGQAMPIMQQSTSITPIWRRFNVDGSLVHEIRVEQQSIVFVCHDYSRWNDVMLKAVDDILALVANIEENKLSSLVLQVTDGFRLEQNENAFTETLNVQSKYLSPNMAALGDVLWHSHQGWFDVMTNNPELSDKVLNRINVNVLDAVNAQREIQIEHFIEQRFVNPTDLVGVTKSFLTDKFNTAHAKNKSVMFDLLHNNMKNKVKLNHESV